MCGAGEQEAEGSVGHEGAGIDTQAHVVVREGRGGGEVDRNSCCGEKRGKGGI